VNDGFDDDAAAGGAAVFADPKANIGFVEGAFDAGARLDPNEKGCEGAPSAGCDCTGALLNENVALFASSAGLLASVAAAGVAFPKVKGFDAVLLGIEALPKETLGAGVSAGCDGSGALPNESGFRPALSTGFDGAELFPKANED